METSAPKRRKLNDGNIASSPRESFNISPLNNSIIENSNDDRDDRRNQVQLQKRMSSICTPEPDNFSESFINEQFTIYTKLYDENKITVKNAWKIPIIDMLKSLCKKQGQDVLQVASTSIDISAKVYGIRVDDLHSKTLKLANDMGRLSEDAAPAGDDSADEQDGGLPSEKAKKKKKKKVKDDAEYADEQDNGLKSKKAKKNKKKKVNLGVKNTIAKNPKANLEKLSKLEPTDFSRVNAYTGQINNLFSNSLKESSSSFILLDASKKFFETSDSTVKNVEWIPLKNVSLPRKNYSLCAPLNDFIVDEWDPVQENNLLNPDKSVLSEIQPVVFDDKGCPIPELDFSDNDADVEMDNDHDDDHIGEIHPRFSGKMEQKKQKIKKKKTPKKTQRTIEKKKLQLIDFFEDPILVDFTKKIIPKKRRTIHINKITLPLMDQSCVTIFQNLKQLMLKPGVCPVEKTDKPVTDTEELEVNCSQSQPNDNLEADDNVAQPLEADDNVAQPLEADDNVAQPLEADDNVAQPLEADDNVAQPLEADDNVAQPLEADDNVAQPLEAVDNVDDVIHVDDVIQPLVNPEMVPNTYIHYAQTSKQVDMKKLKKAIWTKLTDGKSADSEDQQNAKVNPQKFSDVFQSLPESMGKKHKVSCPLAFVALLHVASDKNLQLEQLSGDCNIKGPTDSD